MENNDDLKERLRLYERTRDGLDASARSISESYDRALLTLSSAFLGGSLALTNQVVNLNEATVKWMLYVAWAFFALTIVLTLASFVYGLLTLQPLRDAAERYYIKKEQDAWQVGYKVQRAVLRYVVVCGVSFGLGVALLALFIALNVSKERIVSQSIPERVEKSIPPGQFQKPVELPVQPPANTGPQQPAAPATTGNDPK